MEHGNCIGGSWIIYTANVCNFVDLAYAHFFALDVRREIQDITGRRQTDVTLARKVSSYTTFL